MFVVWRLAQRGVVVRRLTGSEVMNGDGEQERMYPAQGNKPCPSKRLNTVSHTASIRIQLVRVNFITHLQCCNRNVFEPLTEHIVGRDCALLKPRWVTGSLCPVVQ